MSLKRAEQEEARSNISLAKFWHHVKDTPWHAVSYLIVLLIFIVIYIWLKVIIDLYKALEQETPMEAFFAALGIIGVFLVVQVCLNAWTWWILVKAFAQRHIDTSIEEAKTLMHDELKHLEDATERARDMIPLLKGTSWLRAEVDVGNQEAGWERQIWVVVPELTYEMNPTDTKYYKSIANNLNKVKKLKFEGYVYFLPDEPTARHSWLALGNRLRADGDNANFDYRRLKCYFYGAGESTLKVSMHGLVLFFEPDISKCIAYQYLPPGTDHEFMNIIIKGGDNVSKDVLNRCIASLEPYIVRATQI